MLIKICKIALSPIHSFDTIPYLKVFVEEKLHPNSTIKPKMHYLIHCPSQIELHGPLIHTWTMRHEVNLGFVKRSSHQEHLENIGKA